MIAIMGKHGPLAGIEPGALFQFDHAGLDRIEAAAAFFQNPVACRYGA